MYTSSLMDGPKLLFLFFLYLFFSITEAQSPQSNITTSSTLYTNSTPNFWPSSSGHFAFGFYPNGNGFKVGIWLVGSSKDTIVWTARPDDPVLSSGAALLFWDGSLLIRSSLGLDQPIVEPTQVVAASMLDSGNFVLYDFRREIAWASFDHPTDTLLVGQKLVCLGILRSRASDTDHSTGNFQLKMQGDGNLVAFPAKSLSDGRYGYWFSQTSGRGNLSLNLAADSRLYLQNSSGFSIKKLTEGGQPVNSAFFYRATFDPDGVLRLYMHQIGKNGSLINSTKLWSSIDENNRCLVKGVCGLNSYCSAHGANTTCLCPPGFHFVDPEQAHKGCRLNFNSEESCSEDKPSENYSISKLESTSWERDEYEVFFQVNEEDCSRACLEDCSCAVATFLDRTCLKVKLPLRFGNQNSSYPTKTFIKIRIGSLEPHGPPEIDQMKRKANKKILIVGVVLVAFSLAIFLASGYLIYARQIWSYRIIARQGCPTTDVIQEINLRSFSYHQLKEATHDFKEELGRGGSGRVYKGSLPDNGGKEIAVKRLEKMVEEGEYEFRNEMKIIGRTHHKNLVHLVGFCSEGSKRLLVYEFMKNGSLGNLLFNTGTRLCWNERRRISLEIARGLHYLHEECETRIIHCDIKAHNILMDESWGAKISDFGLSKLLNPDQTRTYTVGRGTVGYVAPEWGTNNTPISVKADVFSYGILLLEIICLRKAVDLRLTDEEMILRDWVHKSYEEGELGRLVNGEEVDMEELERTVKVGLWCLQKEVASRPTMKSVILMLEGTVSTPSPPPPSTS